MHSHSKIRLLLLAILIVSMPAVVAAQVVIGIGVHLGPPALPVYEQPEPPGLGYAWTPGFWAWDADAGDYYWVPGTWVMAPVGMLWTPGYWGWEAGYYRWHGGYWGPHVGFYGGVNYGFGYWGDGFEGGHWDRGHYIHDRWRDHEREHMDRNHYSFHGPGGVMRQPSRRELGYAHERHVEPTRGQFEHSHYAASDKGSFYKHNNGQPSIGGTRNVGKFNEPGVTRVNPSMNSHMAHGNNGKFNANTSNRGNTPNSGNRGNTNTNRGNNNTNRYNNNAGGSRQSDSHGNSAHGNNSGPRFNSNTNRGNTNSNRVNNNAGGSRQFDSRGNSARGNNTGARSNPNANKSNTKTNTNHEKSNATHVNKVDR